MFDPQPVTSGFMFFLYFVAILFVGYFGWALCKSASNGDKAFKG